MRQLRRSEGTLAVCGLLISVALCGKLAERRIIADRDDWARTDSTLTAHTIYCPEDSLQLECPPPWLKWYEIDFLDPETGECIFADMGLLPWKDEYDIPYDNPDLIIQDEHQYHNPLDSRKSFVNYGIGMTARLFLHDTTAHPTQRAEYSVIVSVYKFKDLAPFFSEKQLYQRRLDIEDSLIEKTTPGVLKHMRERVSRLAYHKSDCGSYEKTTLAGYTGPDTTGWRDHWMFWHSWSKGLWSTEVWVNGYVNNSLRQTYAFQEAVTARIMQYYRNLNLRYAKEPSCP